MWQKSARYLDYNAGAGLSPYVRQKLIQDLQSEDFFFANPSSRHRLGQKVQQRLFQAAESVASSLHCSSNDLIFTASGTEANQTVLRSADQDHDLILIGSGEHSSSYDLIPHFKKKSSTIPLMESGQYDFAALASLLSEAHAAGEKSVFLSLFWVNHETGVITDLEALKRVIDASPVKITLHLDAAQAWGKVHLDLPQSPAQFVTFSGHKIGAPAGVGLIWRRAKTTLHPLLIGSQGQGLRGGTENVISTLALGYAAEKVDPSAYQNEIGAIRDAFENQLSQSGVAHQIWGRESKRVANTSRVSLKGFSSYQNWVELLDLKGYSVSHGSACRSQVTEPSRVLLQMGASPANALNSIRVSFGPSLTVEDGLGLANAIREIYLQKSTAGAHP